MQIHETMQEGLNFIEKWRSSLFLKIYFPTCLGLIFFLTALLWADILTVKFKVVFKV